jgi:PAS domain S-box-containing protein
MAELGSFRGAPIDDRSLLEALPTAAYICHRGVIVAANSKARDLWGTAPETGQDHLQLWMRFKIGTGEGRILPRHELATLLDCGVTDAAARGRIQLTVERQDGDRVPASFNASPIGRANGEPAPILVCFEVIGAPTEQLTQTEASLRRRVNQQSALYVLTDQLHRAQSLEAVYEASLDAMFRALGCSRASILLFDDLGAMRFVASRGLSERYRAAVDGHSPWKAGDAPAAPIIIDDIATADLDDSLRAVISKEGIRALAFIPLVTDERIVGKFMVYYDHPRSLATGEVDLALTIARQLGFAVARVRDAEARRSAEQALSGSESRLELALEAGRMGAWEWDIVGQRVFWSPNLERLHGIPVGSFGGTFADFQRDVHPDDWERLLGLINGCLETHRPYTATYRIVVPGGGIRWLQSFGRALLSINGTPAKLVGVCMDVTERKRSEEALGESEGRFRGIFENAATGIAIKDLRGRFLHCNPAYESMLGYPESELRALAYVDVVHAQDREANLAEVARLIEGVVPSFEVLSRYVRKTGETLWVQKFVSLLRDGEGHPNRIVALVTDMTERKRYEEHLSLLMREVNHRAKNMLGLVQVVAKQTAASSPRDFVERFSDRLRSLAASQDLLVQEDWSGVALDMLVRSQLAHFESLIGNRIQFVGPPSKLAATAAQTIGMALHELGTNAGKHGALSGAHGQVKLTWGVSEAHEDGPRFTIAWQEDGGPPVSEPARRGFGSTVIGEMCRMGLDASVAVDYAPRGLSWRLECPVENALEPRWSRHDK